MSRRLLCEDRLPLANAQTKLRADVTKCERSELPKLARQLQRTFGFRRTDPRLGVLVATKIHASQNPMRICDKSKGGASTQRESKLARIIDSRPIASDGPKLPAKSPQREKHPCSPCMIVRTHISTHQHVTATKIRNWPHVDAIAVLLSPHFQTGAPGMGARKQLIQPLAEIPR